MESSRDPVLKRVVGLTLMSCLLVGSTTAQTDSVPATVPGDVLACLAAGLPEDRIVAALDREGWTSPLGRRWRFELERIGAGPRLLEHLDSLVPRAALDDLEIIRDEVHQLTWTVNSGWRLEAGAEESKFTRDDFTAGLKVDVSYRILSPPVSRLQSLGIHTLDDLHGRRIDEIRAAEGKTWKWLGTWPLAALGITGIHTVFEEPLTSRRAVDCLTWFSLGDRVLSVRSRLEGAKGSAALDRAIDEVSLILTSLAVERLDRDDIAERHTARNLETVLLVQEDGRVGRWRRSSDEFVAFPGSDYRDVCRGWDRGRAIGITAADLVVFDVTQAREVRRHTKIAGNRRRLGIDGTGEWLALEDDRNGSVTVVHARSGAAGASPTTHLERRLAAIVAEGERLMACIDSDGTARLVRQRDDDPGESEVARFEGTILDVAGFLDRHYVLVAGSSAGESRGLEIWVTSDNARIPLRRIWRGGTSSSASASHGCRLGVSGLTGEIYLLTPGDGLLCLTEFGGLAVRLQAPRAILAFDTLD